MATHETDLPVLHFKDQKAWSAWLEKHHAKSSGVWLKLAKKGSETPSASYAEALEEALRYGWIDGQKKALDESFWLQKFTPRGPRSVWSKVNREKAEELVRSGRMKPSGLAAVERARQNGRWDTAYDSQSRAAVPSDFQAELNRNPQAQAFFATLNSANRYAILWRLQTAKRAETRAKRIEQFIGMLERGEKFHP
jgi:uncharacterized protein YdeI (YjbR/CyaY-like superfamily)